MFKNLLLVEPDASVRASIKEAIGPLAAVNGCADFLTARTQLFATPYDWLVTNVRLRAYNGLHLIHLAASARLPTRVVVYGEPLDPVLARQAQEIGAFYEAREHVQCVISAYLRAALPAQDRRDPATVERRTTFRGGRRAVDSLPTGV